MRACLLLSLAVFLPAPGNAIPQNAAQNAAQSGQAPQNAHDPGNLRSADMPALSPQMEQQLGDRRNVERQKSLEADTQKLLALALQLRDEVAKSNKDQLSVTVVKKSEEIEKLARSVKEKMRGY